ncbi:hypothetical protein E2C01_097341 [Portunus trituberculatus]|uniref:Uncharacterized protein n=1 Tax=Portunus trituberculatus TaxID=210409 RepID=A0A5B7K4D6_PORTR|nr:hypothetical protein [Portunus trituberculatus]
MDIYLRNKVLYISFPSETTLHRDTRSKATATNSTTKLHAYLKHSSTSPFPRGSHPHSTAPRVPSQSSSPGAQYTTSLQINAEFSKDVNSEDIATC